MSVRAKVLMKRYIFVFFMTLFFAACAAPQEKLVTPSPASRTPTSAADIPTVIPFTSTPARSFVPKQNDLIFIEFFAVT